MLNHFFFTNVLLTFWNFFELHRFYLQLSKKIWLKTWISRNLKRKKPFFEKFKILWNLNASMDFPQIQSETSLNIDLFTKNYSDRFLTICDSKSSYKHVSKKSDRHKIPIHGSFSTKMISKEGLQLLQVHTKFQLDRSINTGDTEAWIFRSFNTHTRTLF